MYNKIPSKTRIFYRLRSIVDLSRDFNSQIYSEIKKELKLSEKFALDPQRKESRYFGRANSLNYNRSLPDPGTLIVRMGGNFLV